MKDYLYIWMRRQKGSQGPWLVPQSAAVVRADRLDGLRYAVHVNVLEDPFWEHAIFRVSMDTLERVELTGDGNGQERQT